MVKILAQDKELAKEKATALGDSLGQQIFEMSDSVLKELQAYVDAGDYTEAFVPTAMTNKVMPKYDFDQIGGTGLTDEQDQQTPDPSTAPEQSITPEQESSSNGVAIAVVACVVIVAVIGSYVFYKKKK